MLRIATAALALTLLSGVAVAEPVKLTETQLSEMAAGHKWKKKHRHHGPRYLVRIDDSVIKVNNQVAIALNINTGNVSGSLNQTATAVNVAAQ